MNDNLDKYQLRVIRSKRKKILVLASAGSGKTYTIVNKIKYLLKNNIVKEKDILCISFTNDAVDKLKEDLQNNNIDVLTFHKLALKIINNKKEVLEDGMLYHIINESFNNDVLLGIYKMNKNQMISLIEVFIERFKSKNYNLDNFYKMINKSNKNEKILLKEIMKCYICYETYLNKENLIDFNDMINQAIEKLNYNNIRYKYIIIDEYQDISITKYLLIKKIVDKNKAFLLAVGDDFQSIYKFAGSEIKLIVDFKKYFLFSKIYKLENTYRNSIELTKVSTKFIMKNHNQIRKKIKSKKTVKNPVEIVYYNDLNISLSNVIEEDKVNNVFILSRNNEDLNNVIIKNDITYQKMTIHKSKGLQSKYVFIVNINDSYNGFPNKIKDHKILRYVSDIKEDYLYSEERRLFYVALTRCEEKVYLFAPKNNPSMFINEIKTYENVIIRQK